MNQLMVIGRIATEVEQSEYTVLSGQTRKQISFSVADENNGKTQFMRSVIFGSDKRIEYYFKTLKKGYRYLFIGRMSVQNYEKSVIGNDGTELKIKVQGNTFIIQNIEFADKGGSGNHIEPMESDNFIPINPDELEDLPFR